MATNTHLYRHFNKENILLYVGVSLSAINRLAQHSEHSQWFKDIARVEIENFVTRQEALEAERKAIVNEQPKHNIQHKPRSGRFSKHEVEEIKTNYEFSKQELTRIVTMYPVYEIKDAAAVLGLSHMAVRKLINEGKIGKIDYPVGNKGKFKTVITGWQIIDFLEYMTAKEQKNNTRPAIAARNHCKKSILELSE